MTRLIPLALLVVVGAGILLPAAGIASTESPPSQTIFLDPGHGGNDSGAVRVAANGRVELREKEVNLKIALKTAELLREHGYEVVLSRDSDEREGEDRDVNGDGRISSRDSLQAVVDAANAAGADLFISLHSNSSWDATASGVEVYYCADRPFSDDNRRLADLVQANLLQALADIGYNTVDRGVKEDGVLYQWRGRHGHLFVLGPVRTWGRRMVHPRATEMPGVLAEALFVSNRRDAAILGSEAGQWAIARGYVAAVDAYFAEQ